LGAAARAAGLVVPAFRCPPRVAGARRTLRRYPGGAVVAVLVKGRPFAEVAVDMVEGVIVVNRLATDAATRMRPVLADAVEPAMSRPEAA
jgi:molybdopterin-binding protein